ncbi:hypothetical protein SALBM135S_05728 [Streptomyces alboniger]
MASWRTIGERMELREVEETAGRDGAAAVLAQRWMLQQPAEHPDAGVHDVVRGVGRRLRRVVHVGRDEGGPLRGEPEIGGEVAGRLHGGLGEVEADDAGRPVPRPEDVVEADVALQVQQ